jgi:hypothetical protein
MPQTSVLPQWKADYPILQPRQKPGGYPGTVVRTASASVWAAGVVTLTVPAVTDPVGSNVPITVTGFTPAGFNGSYTGTIASTTSITYPLTTSPGLSTVQGTVSYPGMIPLAISTTLPANAVPNKAMWATPTIQTTQLLSPPAAGSPVMVEAEEDSDNPEPTEDEEEAETE